MPSGVGIPGVSLVTTTAKSRPDSFGLLTIRVAKMVDGVDQPDIMDLAAEGLREAVQHANGNTQFRFNRLQADAITLVDGTSNYTLPTNYFTMSEVQLIDASNLEPRYTLDQWHFNDAALLVPDRRESGIPASWLSHNTFEEQTVELYPEPNAQAASSYKLLLTYYTRVRSVSPDVADGSSAYYDALEELEAFLTWYGKWYVLGARDRSDTTMRRDAERTWREKLELVKLTDVRDKGGLRQFRVAGSRGAKRRAVRRGRPSIMDWRS